MKLMPLLQALVPHFRTQYLVVMYQIGTATAYVAFDTWEVAEMMAKEHNRKTVSRTRSFFFLGCRFFPRSLPPFPVT
jgi:hypothetical protein